MVWNTPLSGFRISVTDLVGKGSTVMSGLALDIEIKELSTLSVEYDLGNFTFTAEHMRICVDSESPVKIPGVDISTFTKTEMLDLLGANSLVLKL